MGLSEVHTEARDEAAGGSSRPGQRLRARERDVPTRGKSASSSGKLSTASKVANDSGTFSRDTRVSFFSSLKIPSEDGCEIFRGLLYLQSD